MGRQSKEYDVRKQEFLDAARELFYANGYEETSVNTIIDKVGVSKGTFYHYFNSKDELLDDLVAHLTKDIIGVLGEIVDDPKMDALTKLNNIFERSGDYKVTNKDLIMTLIRTLYNDKNIRLRLKMNERTVELMTPLMLKIINQGLDEGVFDTAFPNEVSGMIFTLAIGMGEKTAHLIIEIDEHPENAEILFSTFDMYQNAIERLLGAPEGSIHFSAREKLYKILS